MLSDSYAQPMDAHQRLEALDRLAQITSGKKMLYISFLPGQENTQLLIAAAKRYHFQTAVFWMSRGEGMHNYNGYEKGVDLGLIHVAEMEQAASLAGFETFVSSCKDLAGRDTATINATLPVDRLVLDLAAVIRSYRPDVLVVGHLPSTRSDSVGEELLAFNDWMDSISVLASQVASGEIQARMERQSPPPFKVSKLLADRPVVAGGSQDGTEGNLLRLNIQGTDPLTGLSYAHQSMISQRSYRSVFSDSCLNRLVSLLRPVADNRGVMLCSISEAASGAGGLAAWFTEGEQPQLTQGLWQRMAENEGMAEVLAPLIEGLVGLRALITADTTSRITATRRVAEVLKRVRKPGYQDPDQQWLVQQLEGVYQSLSGLQLLANSDRELGVLGQQFRLQVRTEVPEGVAAPKLLWIQVPGLTDTLVAGRDSALILTEGITQADMLLDTSLHIPLFQAAYQPFWLNKNLRADGSYQVDTLMQGRLSDTTSYKVRAHLAYAGDTVTLEAPVYYRNFDRFRGQIVYPFYTIEPVLVSITPTVLLTRVFRNGSPIDQKFIHFTVKTLYKDTAQVAIFKVRKLGLQAQVEGQTVTTGDDDLLYQTAQLIEPKPGEVHELGTVLTADKVEALTSATPFLKPLILFKMPEGGQGFSANIRSVGYDYQYPRLYNYHSQVQVVGDTIRTTGRRLVYVNGLRGDAFENAFRQLGYNAEGMDFEQMTDWLEDIDLTSGVIPDLIVDSLSKLDAIVISGSYEGLPQDSLVMARLRYLLDVYLQAGGRVINLNPDPAMQQLLPAADSVRPRMATAGAVTDFLNAAAVGQKLPRVFSSPNQVGLGMFKQWEGILAPAVLYAMADTGMLAVNDSLRMEVHTSLPLLPSVTDGRSRPATVLSVHRLHWSLGAADNIDTVSVDSCLQREVPRFNLTPIQPRMNTGFKWKDAVQINCFMDLATPLSSGRAEAYQLLANLLSM